MGRGIFVDDHERFELLKLQVEECFWIERSLPNQVFKQGFASFRFEEFDWAMSADFWSALQALCQCSGDASLLIAVLEPDPLKYYRKEFGYFNWAELSVSASDTEYLELLNRFPDESPADSLLANSEKVVWLPRSGKWAIWGERTYEVCVMGRRDSEEQNVWNDVGWALETAIPNAFSGGVIPTDFAEPLSRNYAKSQRFTKS